MSTLYTGGTVLSPGHQGAGALVVDGGLVAWVGTEADAARHVDAVEEVVELGGALVAPAFVDAHAHLSQTGAVLRGVDVASAPTLAVALSRLEDAARAQAGRPLYAPNWDEARWPEGRPATAGELDRASYGGVVYMPRVDGHSAVISSALAAACGARQQPGWRADGFVTREAHHVAREAFTSAVTPGQRRDDIDLALRSAAAAGIGLVHENGGRILSSADDFADVLAAGERGDLPQTIGYWAQLVSDEREARDVAALHHAHGLAGDLNIDGSIGSRTASLHAPYTDAPNHCGNAYLTAEQVRDHIAACSLAGLQGGFHVIGDAGAEAAVAGIEAAAALVGADIVRAARHRLEHLEMVGPEGIARLAALGVTASVQPAFDALWGGGAGMYAARLGPERAGTMNRFAAMAAAGMTVALGSDSPVTPFEPWEAVRAWAWHHSPEQRVPVSLAFDAHTRGGWRAAGVDGRGVLAPGLPATFAVWAVPEPDPTTGLPALRPGDAAPATLRTVVRGQTVHDAGALS